MRKINVITQKELVDQEKIRNCTAVVIDVLLATSTIAWLVENNYEPVYAVKDATEALKIVQDLHTPCHLLGEWNGEKIPGFDYPDPVQIQAAPEKQAVIICSTNGTIAIEKAKSATVLYVASLVNGHRVAESIQNQENESSIVIVCSGNAGRFSMEDFIGAGHLVDCLLQKQEYMLSDSAKLARQSFLSAKSTGFADIYKSETACLLINTGFQESLKWVLKHVEKVSAVPIYQNGKLVNGL
ncbi:2-phosphosulfolactate phosphatase [Fredinandcohnia humi]